MITVYLDRQNFAYDVHSLVKAFYPECDVHIEETAGDTPEKPTPDEGTQESLTLVISFVPARNFRQSDPEDGGQPSGSGQGISCDGDEEHPATGATVRETSIAGIRVRLLAQGAQVGAEETPLQPGTIRREVKNELKRMLYRLLSDYSGRTLPWGNLTGIRPTKIPMSMLEQGYKNAEIACYMRDTYYTSREKTALAIAIANRECHVLRDINFQNGYSLYVGIPFCPSICLYCSFSSSPLELWKKRVDEYLDALCREIDYASEAFADRELNTVYIGGGTPTTLEPHQLERLLTRLESCFCLDRLREFTVEAGRPDSITRGKLEVLRAHGISRISINPQTMNQATLDLIGRRHTVEETVEAFHLARSMGFDNINMDLIVGLPGEGMAEVEHTMQEISKLSPDSVTVHSLAVKRAARLRLFREEHKEMTMTNSAEIMDMTARYAQQAGLFPYYLYRQKNMAGNFENVGYAKDGREGIYNILIMEEMQSILALGAGGATKLVRAGNRIERIENVKDIKNYIERIDEMIARKKAGLQ